MFLSLPDDDIIIADPEGEYYPLVNRLGGQVVRLSPSATAGTFINPMDINPNYADDEDPLSLKSDFILSLCELIVGGRSGLAPVEKTVIDRCVRTIYRPYLADPAPERMPILQDLYDELLKQSEPEARRVASALELYCTGSLNLFNHRTNVQVNSRLLCFDIKALGKMLKKIGLLILTDQIWGRVTENRDRRRATWVYQDEFHVLLAEPQTAAYSVEIFRRFRKWGAIPRGIKSLCSKILEKLRPKKDCDLPRGMDKYLIQRRPPKGLLIGPSQFLVCALPSLIEDRQQPVRSWHGGGHTALFYRQGVQLRGQRLIILSVQLQIYYSINIQIFQAGKPLF